MSGDQMLRAGEAPPLLVATDACDAPRPGRCPVCGRRYSSGDRIANLVDGHGWAHIRCCSRLAGQPG